MILPVGAPTLSRGAALRRRDLPHAQEGAARAQAHHRGRRRRRLRARTCRRTRRRSKSILEAIEQAGYKPGKEIYLGLDVASTEFYKNGSYELESRGPQVHLRRSSPSTSQAWSARYPIITHRGRHGRGRLGRLGAADAARSARSVQLVGDDLFVTNTKILKEGIDEEDRQRDPDQGQPDRHADRDARRHRDGRRRRGYAAVVSHRSGETEDTTIADIAVATTRDADQDRLDVALGSHRQVQPAAAHRRGAGRATRATRARGVPVCRCPSACSCCTLMKLARRRAADRCWCCCSTGCGSATAACAKSRGCRRRSPRRRQQNARLRERNRTLAAEVQDLKKGTTAIEERARSDLGMVGKSETFYQVVSPERPRRATRRLLAQRASGPMTGNTGSIVPAAGSVAAHGGAGLPKQYLQLAGRSVIEWALAPFLRTRRLRAHRRRARRRRSPLARAVARARSADRDRDRRRRARRLGARGSARAGCARRRGRLGAGARRRAAVPASHGSRPLDRRAGGRRRRRAARRSVSRHAEARRRAAIACRRPCRANRCGAR